jgi:hypothetical protein
MKSYRVLWAVIGLLILFLLTEPLVLSVRAAEGDYSQEQLSQMLAPIALYPDDLLSQVLMASTYPLEVVEADRWVKKNPLLTGANLDEALKDKDWDASVKALCHVPTLLALMSERLEETTDLGNAFLAQESEVMSAIQDLRHRAYQEGNLSSNDNQKVIFKSDGTIVIEPADPQIVYVPYYNPRYVYGLWLYPDYPPWYWGPAGVAVGAGIYFWPDFYVGFSFGFGYWSYFDWPRRTIIIDVHRRPRFFRHDYDWASQRGSWRHNPNHRRGVVYRNRITAEKFGQYPKSGQVFDRRRWRFPAQQSKNRPSVERRGGNNIRGPVTARPAPVAKPGARERTPAGKKRVISVPEQRGTSAGKKRVTSVPEQRGTSAGKRRVTSVPEQRGAPAGRRAQPGKQENTTVFGGISNGREEGRSSIRGGASRGAMRWQGKQEGRDTPSPSGHNEKRGGGRSGFHR